MVAERMPSGSMVITHSLELESKRVKLEGAGRGVGLVEVIMSADRVALV